VRLQIASDLHHEMSRHHAELGAPLTPAHASNIELLALHADVGLDRRLGACKSGPTFCADDRRTGLRLMTIIWTGRHGAGTNWC
jgi:hypothetical protein